MYESKADAYNATYAIYYRLLGRISYYEVVGVRAEVVAVMEQLVDTRRNDDALIGKLVAKYDAACERIAEVQRRRVAA